jgi:hypothetical protein
MPKEGLSVKPLALVLLIIAVHVGVASLAASRHLLLAAGLE